MEKNYKKKETIHLEEDRVAQKTFSQLNSQFRDGRPSELEVVKNTYDEPERTPTEV